MTLTQVCCGPGKKERVEQLRATRSPTQGHINLFEFHPGTYTIDTTHARGVIVQNDPSENPFIDDTNTVLYMKGFAVVIPNWMIIEHQLRALRRVYSDQTEKQCRLNPSLMGYIHNLSREGCFALALDDKARQGGVMLLRSGGSKDVPLRTSMRAAKHAPIACRKLALSRRSPPYGPRLERYMPPTAPSKNRGGPWVVWVLEYEAPKVLFERWAVATVCDQTGSTDLSSWEVGLLAAKVRKDVRWQKLVHSFQCFVAVGEAYGQNGPTDPVLKRYESLWQAHQTHGEGAAAADGPAATLPFPVPADFDNFLKAYAVTLCHRLDRFDLKHGLTRDLLFNMAAKITLAWGLVVQNVMGRSSDESITGSLIRVEAETAAMSGGEGGSL